MLEGDFLLATDVGERTRWRDISSHLISSHLISLRVVPRIEVLKRPIIIQLPQICRNCEKCGVLRRVESSDLPPYEPSKEKRVDIVLKGDQSRVVDLTSLILGYFNYLLL